MSKIKIEDIRPSRTMLLKDLKQKSYFQLERHETIFIKLSDVHQDIINNSECPKYSATISKTDICCLCIASIKKENYKVGMLIGFDESTKIVPIRKSSFVVHQ